MAGGKQGLGMGTNFYWVTEPIKLPTGELICMDQDDPRIHIGKRSAAGLYCWDCKVTLCKGGEAGIHHSKNEWHSACPECGATRSEDMHNTINVELGFSKVTDNPRRGIQGCCSFTFAQDPLVVKRICTENRLKKIIEDEYDRQFTGSEFLDDVLAYCPIKHELLGQRFC